MRCTAIKRDGSPCHMWAIKGSTKCKYHGGKSPKSIASPHFKTGRYSRYLPKGLIAKFEEGQNDSELLSLRNSIALADARVKSLMEQLPQNGDGDLTQKQARRLSQDLLDHLDAERYDEARALAVKVQQFVEEGQNATRTWREINVTLETRRRLSESEQRRLVAMNQAISVESALSLVTTLAGIVRKYVSDRAALNEIANELAKLTGTRTVVHRLPRGKPEEPIVVEVDAEVEEV